MYIKKDCVFNSKMEYIGQGYQSSENETNDLIIYGTDKPSNPYVVGNSDYKVFFNISSIAYPSNYFVLND